MDRVDIVVAYYWNSSRANGQPVIALTTQLSLLLLRETPAVGKVVLVDGSPRADASIRDMCVRLQVEYLHFGRELSLPEAYNLGWRSLSGPYVGLMANDVLPYPLETMELLLRWIKAPDVGCVFPYLSDGILYTQHLAFSDGRTQRTCEPASMTLNLNIFKRSALEDVGGVDEGFLAGYYDPILLIKIRKLGLRVILVGGAKMIHYDQLTKRIGGSTLISDVYAKDTEKWFREYTSYAAADGIGNLLFWRWPCATTLRAMLFWWASHHFPVKRLRRTLLKLGMWIEPYLTEYPARYGNRKMFSSS